MRSDDADRRRRVQMRIPGWDAGRCGWDAKFSSRGTIPPRRGRYTEALPIRISTPITSSSHYRNGTIVLNEEDVFDLAAELSNAKSHPSRECYVHPFPSAHTTEAAMHRSCAAPDSASHVHLSHLSTSSLLDVVFRITPSDRFPEASRASNIKRNLADAATSPLRRKHSFWKFKFILSTYLN
jgi:hypothetical protein